MERLPEGSKSCGHQVEREADARELWEQASASLVVALRARLETVASLSDDPVSATSANRKTCGHRTCWAAVDRKRREVP
jgi:hypothetical protein